MRAVASLVILAAAASALAGCGEQAAAPAAPGDLVLLRAGAERTLALGAGSPRALPAGQPAAGWRSLYTATPTGAATAVARVDVASGRTLGSLRLPGRWTLPATVIGGAPDAATADGRTLVLARAGARTTRFALVDASLRRAPASSRSPAASPSTPSRPTPGGCSSSSSDRAATTSSATTTSCATSSCPAPSSTSPSRTSAMEGRPVARATPAAGPWVYTLYRKAAGPFVHALNTEGFALCIDLPGRRTLRSRCGGRVGARARPRRRDALRRQPRARPRRRDRRPRARRAPHGPDPQRRDRRGATAGGRARRRDAVRPDRGWRGRGRHRRRCRCGARCCPATG